MHMKMLRLCFVLLSCHLILTAADGPDELRDLVARSGAPPRFASHQPAFTIEDATVQTVSPTGPATAAWRVLRDHGLVVGFLSDRDRRWESTTFIPGQGQAGLPHPPRYHNATMVDTRLIIGYGQQPERWSTPVLRSSVADGVATFAYAAERPDGTQRFRYDLRIRVDPVLGYVAEVDCLDERRTPPKKGEAVEFINHFTRGLTDVWPGASTYDQTIVCRAGRPGFTGWWNNLAGVELSDVGNRDVRTGGFMAWVGGPGIGDGQGRAMSWLAGDHVFATCNCWADNHNHVRGPAQPDAEGWYRTAPRFRLTAVPAEAVALAVRETAFDDFKRRPSVFVRVGVREDFTGQPFAPDTAVRGMYCHDGGGTIDQTGGRGGSPALRIAASKGLSTFTGFFNNPQVNLREHRHYRFTAWVKPVGAVRSLYLSGDTYEWTPHDPARLSRQRSAVIGSEPAPADPGQPAATTDADGWTRLEVRVATPAYDVNIDPRIIVLGEAGAAALVDDLELVEITDR
jgi:hypothetical protein